MNTINRAAPLLAIVPTLFLSGCVEATLPRFDGGLLNPEIRLLRAGEILDSVKCAMVAFMHEREHNLLMVRQKTKCMDGRAGEVDDARLCQIEGKEFGPYHVNADSSVGQKTDHSLSGIHS
jgi:hypothetical protein